MYVVFDIFTFREHKNLFNGDKFPHDITFGVTFREDKKIPVKLLQIILKRKKQKHYLLIIRGNPHTLMKCSLK